MKLFLMLFLISLNLYAQSYNRKDWPHWTKERGNCQDTRARLLIKESLVSPTLKTNGCAVTLGKWKDFYSNEYYSDPKDLDIDHVIPLKRAHDSVGLSWTKEKRKQFANDPENLVIAYKKFNRQKGAKGISEWLPSNKEIACQYIKKWLRISSKYSIPLTPQERDTISIIKCL